MIFKVWIKDYRVQKIKEQVKLDNTTLHDYLRSMDGVVSDNHRPFRHGHLKTKKWDIYFLAADTIYQAAFYASQFVK